MCCKPLRLISNEFHLVTAVPCNMECDMKQPPDSYIIEEIVTHLGRPLWRPGAARRPTNAEVVAALKKRIEMLHDLVPQPFPSAASIKKAAKNLHEALEPFGDGQQIPLGGCDRHVMTMRELRSALDSFEHLDGPSSKHDRTKWLCATFADGLVNEFSEKPPRTTDGGPCREIARLLYESVTGKKADLKRAVDVVRRGWKEFYNVRGR
jgi:hypothetical protein